MHEPPWHCLPVARVEGERSRIYMIYLSGALAGGWGRGVQSVKGERKRNWVRSEGWLAGWNERAGGKSAGKQIKDYPVAGYDNDTAKTGGVGRIKALLCLARPSPTTKYVVSADFYSCYFLTSYFGVDWISFKYSRDFWTNGNYEKRGNWAFEGSL